MAGRPQYRRFGFVDFDAMASLPSSEDADQFVCRRANGDNVVVTRADIIAGAGSVPDPLLLNDGTVGAPTYSFVSNPTAGLMTIGGNTVSLVGGGVELFRAAEGGIADQVIVTPGLTQDVSILPALAIDQSDKGFYSPALGVLRVATPGGGGVFDWEGINYQGVAANGPALRSISATATVANVHPNKGDLNTGVGSAGDDILSLIAGGVEGMRLTEAAGTVQVQISDGTEAAPASSWLGDPGTGFRRVGGGQIQYSALGSNTWQLTANVMGAVPAGGPILRNEVSSNTNPTFNPHSADAGSGLGGISGQPSLIAGGLSCISVSEAAGARQIGFYDRSPIAKQTGVAVTTAAVHASLVSLGLIAA